MNLVRFRRPEDWNWSAFDRLSNLQDEINRLFESPFPNSGFDVFNTWAPPIDIYEDKDNLLLRMEIAGMRKEDIDIALHDNTITISGERRKPSNAKGGKTTREERFFGRFTRSLALPKQIDAGKVKASYKDGVLTVTLPKAEEAKPRQIVVK